MNNLRVFVIPAHPAVYNVDEKHNNYVAVPVGSPNENCLITRGFNFAYPPHVVFRNPYHAEQATLCDFNKPCYELGTHK